MTSLFLCRATASGRWYRRHLNSRRRSWAKINDNMSSSVRFGALKGVGVCFELDVHLEKNWSEVLSKVGASVRTELRRRLSLKGRAELCSMYIFLIVLYRISVIRLYKGR